MVDEYLDDPDFTTERLAASLGMSRRQLQRRLVEICGETPSQLVRRKRLERARRLLEADVGTVADVAELVGYRSRSHFAVAFSELCGVSPGEYRREYAERSGLRRERRKITL